MIFFIQKKKILKIRTLRIMFYQLYFVLIKKIFFSFKTYIFSKYLIWKLKNNFSVIEYFHNIINSKNIFEIDLVF